MSQAASSPHVRASSPPRETSTLDLLKTIAVLLMVADHVGLYFYDDPWLRVLGRPAAVIFGFLIGYSRTRRVPPLWIGLGLGLSLLGGWLYPESDDRALDILISLALARIVVPFLERIHDMHPLWLVPASAVLAMLTEPVNVHLEYGTEVMILAMLGVAVRLDDGSRARRTGREAVALVSMIAISLIAIRHFEFRGWEAIGCTALLALTIVPLARFELKPAPTPAWLSPVLRFCGRNTLWIYAIHLALFQIGQVSWNALADE